MTFPRISGITLVEGKTVHKKHQNETKRTTPEAAPRNG